MNRSKWKGYYIDPIFTRNVNFFNNKNLLPVISRNSAITPNFIDLKFNVHNGKTFIEVLVSKEMIGHKFGEFVKTRTKPNK